MPDAISITGCNLRVIDRRCGHDTFDRWLPAVQKINGGLNDGGHRFPIASVLSLENEFAELCSRRCELQVRSRIANRMAADRVVVKHVAISPRTARRPPPF